jgi:lycopene beta-cyclase
MVVFRHPRRVVADFVVVGAGCAGLSLAAELVSQGLGDRRIVLVDPRTSFDRDRTWCYWDVAPHGFLRAVSHTWSRWRVRLGEREVVRSSPTHRYCHVPADAFYRAALARLTSSDRVELRLGVRAEKLRETQDGVVVETSAGPLLGRLAFDSRPRAPLKGAPHLVQHFAGHVVRAEAPVFDPEVVTLMDFDVGQERGIHFFYVLPYDARTALVEATYLTAEAFPREVYVEAIRAYLERRFGLSRWEVLWGERGAIPMTTEPLSVRASRRIYRIGLAGGLAKPSTGYAFLAIQRFSSSMAARLRAEEAPEPPPVRPARSAFLDRVFLSYIRRHPERAPLLFVRLFERVAPDVLVRFLSDAGSLADDLKVMSALPALPLIAEAARAPWG